MQLATVIVLEWYFRTVANVKDHVEFAVELAAQRRQKILIVKWKLYEKLQELFCKFFWRIKKVTLLILKALSNMAEETCQKSSWLFLNM